MNNTINNRTNHFQTKVRLAGMMIALVPISSFAEETERVPWNTGMLANNGSCSIVTQPGTSLGAAKQLFAASCAGLERQDCDPISGNRWMCSTENIDASTIVSSVTPAPESSIPVEPPRRQAPYVKRRA